MVLQLIKNNYAKQCVVEKILKHQKEYAELNKEKISENKRSVEETVRNIGQNTSNNVNRNLEAGDVVDINTGDIKKADGTIIKKDGTIIRPNTFYYCTKNTNPRVLLILLVI